MTEPLMPPNAPPEPLSPLPAPAPLVGEPTRADPAGLPALTAAEVAGARGYIDASRAASTRKAYGADWLRFSLWCRGRNTPALPAAPALVAVYLSALAARGQAPPSIARALAAIAHHHRRAGKIPPHRAEGGLVIADILADIRRSRVLGPERKAAADADVVLQLLGSIAWPRCVLGR
jgi:hypothetical protein